MSMGLCHKGETYEFQISLTEYKLREKLNDTLLPMNFQWYHKTQNTYHSKIKRIKQIIVKYGTLKTQTANNRNTLNGQVTIYL
jgi:hypothetical protein